MSIIAEKYELPANGEQLISNSSIAAALAAIGVGGSRQITEHIRRGSPDKRYFAFHLSPKSNQFPDVKTSALVGDLQGGRIPRDGPWSESVKLFMAGWVALENRRVLLHAEHEGNVESLQMRRIAEGICLLHPPVRGNELDLRKTPTPGDGRTLRKVKSKVLSRALISVGFVPVQFLFDGGVLFTSESLTFHGLTMDLCLGAYGQILEYNAAVEDAIARGELVLPKPPVCPLPGEGPNGHPFENAVQAGLNLAQILQHVLPQSEKKHRTFAFQNEVRATRCAIIDASAPDRDIDEALNFATAN